ncbi:MAG: phosphoribosylamine--glycine ligase [Candidatus Marinimicrobia bacterium]|nr:phosphoribosylamine--glycine ligase [Candidatus Neomarinimicrobiota bacterium]MCF7830053.1 phosphoribosylamine--glycine ligase [Candidatus Neomarinimicrobiota bacterium]MCF7882354.1 phosphoribosylamine--glycine ligase [Candidatus Neomarinimicrobiota bacterium]
MKVLVIGSGGREHTIAWKVAQSPRLSKLYIAPGNAGTASLGENVDIGASDIDELVEFAKENEIDLTIVGPEQPLVDGVVDAFQEAELAIFGPDKAAAQLEGSKAFSKDFMARHNIPTASYKTFNNFRPAKEYLKTVSLPVIVKASGLAAGKGVIICQSIGEALDALEDIMKRHAFGEAGDKVVIEEFLQGEEVSIIAITDGENYKMLLPSQDHKPAYDGGRGPNTGGMGAYAPAPVASEEVVEIVRKDIIEPTLTGMKEEGHQYTGFLYCGLMITRDGPKVLEYNCRLGDPETQVILPLLESDLLDVLESVIEGGFAEEPVELSDDFATCVVAASGGYPGKYSKGKEITGLSDVDADYAEVFHAGTKERKGKIVTDGGRVFGVTCRGETLQKSIDRVYEELDKIKFNGMQFRSDIGRKGLRYY